MKAKNTQDWCNSTVAILDYFTLLSSFVINFVSVSSSPLTSTVFPLISAGAALIRGAYFIIRKINNNKCQNLAILSSKIRMKYKSSLSKKQI